jgi:SAM-dependent methyltransferase
MPAPQKWPKVLPPLTAEQRRISDEFMKLWHEVLPKRFGLMERFNHSFPVRHSKPGFTTTLEVGAGLGEHLRYERLTPAQEKGYHCLELRDNMAAEIRREFPNVQVLTGDCQKRLPFPDGYFDRVVAVHVFEHLPDLPKALAEIHRILNKERGQLLIVIPTEDSLAYKIARKISAERVYKKHFGGDYSWFYKREHINLPAEIEEEMAPYFVLKKRSWFPFFFIPRLFCNLCLGLSLEPRAVRVGS